MLVALAAAVAARGAHALTLTRDAGQFVVRGRGYEARISPADGGRVVGLVVGGVRTTGLGPDGRGGLLGEVHSADRRHDVVEESCDGRRARIVLACTAGPLRIARTYTFRHESAWFEAEIACTNTSRLPCAGAAAPALRSLGLPAGRATGREVYGLDRGLGAETATSEFLVPRLAAGPGPARLRWLAVTDPALRRSLGFVLEGSGATALTPRRAAAGGLLLGWRYPAVPPGQTLRARVRAGVVDGLTAVRELNTHFAADCVPTPEGPHVARLDLVPIGADLADVSVVTRAVGDDGAPRPPCDTLLFDAIEQGRHSTATVRGPPLTAQVDWLRHGVYSRGRELARFAVPVGTPRTPAPPSPTGRRPAVEGQPAAPGPPDSAAGQGGLLVWRFDHVQRSDGPDPVAVTLLAGQTRTIFLGVRAVRARRAVRVSTGPPRHGPGRPMPPAAVYVWAVDEPPNAPAELLPADALDLVPGRPRWIAVTVDAGALTPGLHAADLVVGGEPDELRVELHAEVLDRDGPPPEAFALWHLNPPGSPAARTAELRAAGATAHTAARPPDAGTAVAGPAAARRWADAAVYADALRGGLTQVGFWRAAGALPPKTATGATLLPSPVPTWTLRQDVAPRWAVEAAAREGFSPAVLCDQLPEATGARPDAWLVDGGPAPGRVRALLDAGTLTGSEPVWAHLDLRDADWRRAAIEVRAAAWAAGWQGLAGLAVTCPPPGNRAGRQNLLWHILRDACADVGLWRTLGEAGAGSAAGAAAAAAVVRVVGTQPDCILRIESARGAFRSRYTVAGGALGDEPRMARFESARAAVMDAARRAPLPAEPAADNVYWGGVPMVEGGLVRWAIAAGAGDDAWSKATELRDGIQRHTGRAVPLSRGLAPESPGEPTPLLVWVVPGDDPVGGLPDAARSAIAEHPAAPLLVVQAGPRTQLVLLRAADAVPAVLRALAWRRTPWPTSREAR